MATSSLTTEHLLESLKNVIDPEVGINIVDLGLVYSVELVGSAVMITMTLTTPGCPLHATISAAVERALYTCHPELSDVMMNLVWDPPWCIDCITEEGRRQLGW